MPPVLDQSKSKVDGLAFIGLSLARNHSVEGNSESYTHQTAFDFNNVLDREYNFIAATNDDGWLVGGGEPGPPSSYKLAAKDSGHVEIMRIGTYRKDWGGLDITELLQIMTSSSTTENNQILIPQIDVLPTSVIANPDKPPELEIRFDMEPEIPIGMIENDFNQFCIAPLPINWQLRFIHNQLFKTFVFPSRFCPGPFHSTIVRKADFRSNEHRKLYFEKCDKAIEAWRTNGPQPLNTIPRALDGTPLPVTETEEEVVEETPSNSDVTTAGIVADKEAVDKEAVAAPSDAAEATLDDVITEKVNHDDERYGEEKKECGGDDDDEVAPTSPPFAFTARATSNLEVSLDEGYGDGDGDVQDKDNDIDEEDANVKEREEIEAVDTKFTEDDEEKVTAEDDNEDEDKDQAPEIPTLDTAGSTETEKNERTGMYRHTWNDLVRVADSKDSFVSNLTASKEEEDRTETESTSTALAKEDEGTAAAVENAENVKKEEEEEDTTTNDPLPEEEKEMKTEDVTAVTPADSCHSGIWLFTDRENTTHFFPPNFYPPYDTVEKRRIIFDVLKEEWDEKSLSFKPCGQGSMTKKKHVEDTTRVFARQVDEMVSGVSGVISTVIDSVCSPQNSPDKPPASVSK